MINFLDIFLNVICDDEMKHPLSSHLVLHSRRPNSLHIGGVVVVVVAKALCLCRCPWDEGLHTSEVWTPGRAGTARIHTHYQLTGQVEPVLV